MRRLLLSVAFAIGGSLVGVAPPVAATPTTGFHSVNGCGDTVLKDDDSPWVCTFVDHFGGRRLDRTKWTPQVSTRTGTATAGACTADHPDNVAVGSGKLMLTVRKVDTPVTCGGITAHHTTGSVMTYRLFSQQYGRFEARIKVHATVEPGLHEAFWLWPDDRTVTTPGEIDIVETYSEYPFHAIPFLHYNQMGPVPGVNTAWHCMAKRGTYHTYVLTWTPTKLSIDVDGTPCLVNTSGDPAFQQPYIMALTTALGVGSNELTAATPVPATMAVDYVKVWR